MPPRTDPYSDLWYMLQDQGRYVYHYTDSESLRLILNGGKLRFSRMDRVNDPRESRQWLFSYVKASDVPATARLSEELNHELKYSWRIGCFSSDPYNALVTVERENGGENFIGAIYERGHARPRMWSQYAKEFSGACLVFDRAKLDLEVQRSAGSRKVYSGLVEYRNPPIARSLLNPDALIVDAEEIGRFGVKHAAESHVQRHYRELFFLKSEDWKQEREYRWAVKSEACADFYIKLQPALVGIAMGDRFPDFQKVPVCRFSEMSPIRLCFVEWANGVPQLQPTLRETVERSITWNVRSKSNLIDYSESLRSVGRTAARHAKQLLRSAS